MNCKYILDTNIVLDYMLDRINLNVNIYDIFLKLENSVYISSSQIHNIEYIFLEERKRSADLETAKNEWIVFISKVKVIKTPSYINIEDDLFKKDSEAYLIELSAKTIDAKVVTRDKSFLNNSSLAISIDDFLGFSNKKIDKIIFLDLQEISLSYYKDIEHGIDNVIKSGWYILGQEVKKFEQEFSAFVGTKYALGVASGTDAIFLSLKALGIGVGDEVITVSHTATATISAIEATGAKAIFVDIEEECFTLDVEKVEEMITSKTKAIVPVHIYGHSCDMDELSRVAKDNDLHIIEDCAQASGARYKNKEVGSLGDLGCFSFFPTKNLGALGDGGAITTNSKELYERLLMLRQYGWNEVRESQFQGYNSRLDEIQAAILRVKLKNLKQDIEKRNKVASLYKEYLKNNPKLVLPKEKKDCYHAYHLFVIKVDNRDELVEFLKQNGISTMVHYNKAVHMQEAYKLESCLPITEKIVDNILSLPLYPELKEKEIKYIAEIIKKFTL